MNTLNQPKINENNRYRSNKWKITHGETRNKKQSKEYSAWMSIKGRCFVPTNKKYYMYGGRGIKVCDKWVNSFVSFLEDVGRSPTSKHSIDRFPNMNGHYEPGNVRWATPKEQSANTRINHYMELNGEKKHLAEWGRIFGVGAPTILHHLNKGRTPDEIKIFYQNKNK